jgi:N-acetylmuramoyl-L-alanine amidase
MLAAYASGPGGISMLKIEKHRLVGDKVTHRDTPNVGGALAPRFLVFHYTAGRSAASSVESLCTRKPSGNASAHIVLAPSCSSHRSTW